MPDPSFLNPISVLSEIGGISIDITEKITENYPNIVTQNPIENGSPTNDHIVNLPPRIQIQGGFSDIKLTNLVGTTGQIGIDNLSLRNRAKNQIDKLIELNVKKTLFRVMDGLHLFTDMFFNNLQVLKDKEGFSVFFQADIQGIRIVDLSKSGRKITPAEITERAVVANTTLLTVGATVERTGLLETVNILA